MTKLALADAGTESAQPVKDPPPPWVGPAGARDFPGRADAVRAARNWAREVAAGAGAEDPDAAALIVSELVTNAIIHTRSGMEHGFVTLAVTAGVKFVDIHVHDEGDWGLRPGARARGEHGRGLVIVDRLSVTAGFGPADGCEVRPGAVGGRCTWVLLPRDPEAEPPVTSNVPVSTTARESSGR